MTTCRNLLTLVLVAWLLSGDVTAQTARPRQQRVDPKTASIKGIVTTADTGAPVRGVEVRAGSSSFRMATTDGDGRFELRDLPAGEYRLTASRSGFTPLQFGQRRPLEAASVIKLAEGEQFTANMALIKGGAIYGRVFDPFGEPLAGTRVQVLRARVVEGQRRLQSMGPGDQTDDTGAYRVYGLPPGDYFVTASIGAVDAVKREPPIYYPGTPSLTEALPLTLDLGAEAVADFQLAPIKRARVSGVVFNASGAPVEAMVHLASQAVGLGPSFDNSQPAAFMINADSGPDGAFTIENVPPGPYTLVATQAFDMGLLAGAAAASAGRATPDKLMAEVMARWPETALLPIVVTGDDLTGLSLTMRRGGTLKVSLALDSGVVKPLPRGLRVTARASQGGSMLNGGGREEFTLGGMTGPFYLDVQDLPEGWVVREVTVDGADVTDQPIDLKGQNATARVVLTDQASSVSGVVQSRDESQPLSVVVFPEDSARWTYPSRFVRVTKTDDQGHFRVTGLPPNERYLALAVDYLEDGDEQDPQVLEQLRGRATTFSLRDGEERSLWLDLVSRQ